MFSQSRLRAVALPTALLVLSACSRGEDTRLQIANLNQNLAAQSARVASLENEVGELTAERDALSADVERLKGDLQDLQQASAMGEPAPDDHEIAAPFEQEAEPLESAVADQSLDKQPTPPVTEATEPEQPEFAIHLASYRRLDQVKEAWPKLVAKYPDLLGDLLPHVTKLELEDMGGLYYRLKAGPFATRDAANQRCEQFKQMDEYCVVSAFDGRGLDVSP